MMQEDSERLLATEWESRIAARDARIVELLAQVESLTRRVTELEIMEKLVAQVLHDGRTSLAFIQIESRRLATWLPTLFEGTPSACRRRETELPDILLGLDTSAEILRGLFDLLKPMADKIRP